MAKRFAIVALVLFASACAHVRPMSAGSHGGWPVLTPSSFGKTESAAQILRVAYGDREATLNCVVAVSPERIVVIGTTALGMRAFTIKYDGAKVQAEAQAGVPQAMEPERLLNDLQLVYWPLSAIQHALANTEWEISEPATHTRRLKHRGKLAAEVHYATDQDLALRGRAWLANLEFGYTLTIDSQISGP